MTQPITSRTGLEQLLETLTASPDVRHAYHEPSGNRIFLVCEQERPEGVMISVARRAAAEAGLDGADLEFIVSYTAAPSPPRRARFLGAEIERPVVGSAMALVVLEWKGERHEGRAEGEATVPGEMRACAHATIKALRSVTGETTRLNLVGIKATRIFDTDLVAVLLQGDGVDERGLIGASLVTESIHQAAALAVLNATNRLLGNFLSTTD